MTPDELIERVKEIVSPVYLVGGGTRDILLGHIPKDYDFTTPLQPDEVEARVKAAGRRAYTTGARFGTIGFKVMDGTKSYYVEVTTHRSEQYQPNNRKPNVEFVSDLKEDLSRRDFTINAIAYDGQQPYDPFAGRIDLLAKKIKAVGDGNQRIKDDPLRMLRAARFAAQLGFEVDPNFIGLMRKHAAKIMYVSRERWVQELDKLLMSKEPRKGLDVLANSYVLKFVLPELWLLYLTDAWLWGFTRDFVADAPEDVNLRWVALLSQIGKPFAHVRKREKDTYPEHAVIASYMAEGIAERLKWSNNRRNVVIETLKKGAV